MSDPPGRRRREVTESAASAVAPAADVAEDLDVSQHAVPPDELQTARMGARQLRGSTVLLVGRIISLFFTVATQVIIVRALSKSEYGAFAFALAITGAARMVLSLGQGRTMSRFLSIHKEQRDYGRMLGTTLIAVGTIACTSVVLLASLLVFSDTFVGSVLDDPSHVTVLLILVFVAPMEALDQVFVSLFAVFTKPKAIFFRKYLFTPGLRFVVVLAMAASGSSVIFLAIGYVAAYVLGLLVYTVMLVQVFRARGILRGLRLRDLRWPVRSVLSFSMPLLSTELVVLSMNTGSVLLLTAYHDVAEVAAYRAVFPAARLNQVVYSTFLTLFLPLAARLFIRSDDAGMRTTYWRTAAFLGVFSFPVFALTGPFAPVTTVTLFGERYADSAPVLALLAVGYYVNCALGFNTATLQAYGKVRYLFGVNVFAAVANLALSFLLTPRYGAVGVGIANCATLATQNLLNQIGLHRTLRTPLIDREYFGTYGSIVVAAALLWGIQILSSPGIFVSVILTAIASLAVLARNRRLLKLNETFPELRRVPLIRRVLQ